MGRKRRVTSILTIAGVVFLAVLATTLEGGLTTGASAGSPSDPRAEFIEGNTPPGACGAGTEITSHVNFTLAADGKSVTINSVEAGFTVSFIIVKGGDDTNKYIPGQHGLPASPPWTDLISPFTNGGQIPAISHWFVCGGGTATTTTSTTTTTTLPPTT